MKIPTAPRGGVSRIGWDFQSCKYPERFFFNPTTASGGVFATNKKGKEELQKVQSKKQ